MSSSRSAESITSRGIPSSLANTFVAPPGSRASGVAEPARPLATSLTVPSPPNATTTSKPSCAAPRASSVACPRSRVRTASTA